MKRKGQSVLEYVIILSAIIGAVVLFVTNFKGNVKRSLEHAATQMGNQIDEIKF